MGYFIYYIGGIGPNVVKMAQNPKLGHFDHVWAHTINIIYARDMTILWCELMGLIPFFNLIFLNCPSDHFWIDVKMWIITQMGMTTMTIVACSLITKNYNTS